MSKRRVYTGVYTHPHQHTRVNGTNRFEFQKLTSVFAKFLRMIYSPVAGNYVAIVSIVFVALLGFVLPQKVHHKELKDIKNVLNQMTEEVSRAEVACLTAAKQVCCLHSICDDTTETTQELHDILICTSRGLLNTHSKPVQVEKKSVSFAESSSIGTHPERKSQSCRLYIPIHSTIEKD